MSTNGPGGNIFLTTENLAFSMPLIAVCSIYAYFKFIPLKYGLPALAGLAGLILIKSQVKTHQDKKLENMDSDTIDAIARELDDSEKKDSKEEAQARLLQKKKNQVQQRLAAEKRKEEKKAKSNRKKKSGGDDDGDDDNLMTFAKGSRAGKKKN